MRRPRAILVALLSLLVFAALPAQATRSIPSLADSFKTQAPLELSRHSKAASRAPEKTFALFDEEDLSLFAASSCLDRAESRPFAAENRIRLFADSTEIGYPAKRLWGQKTAVRASMSDWEANIRARRDLAPTYVDLFFQGAWTDPTTGIAYHRNRWYDPRTASWLSEDPAGAVDSPNLYAFVGWGPQAGTDPLGLQCACGCGEGSPPCPNEPQVLFPFIGGSTDSSGGSTDSSNGVTLVSTGTQEIQPIPLRQETIGPPRRRVEWMGAAEPETEFGEVGDALYAGGAYFSDPSNLANTALLLFNSQEDVIYGHNPNDDVYLPSVFELRSRRQKQWTAGYSTFALALGGKAAARRAFSSRVGPLAYRDAKGLLHDTETHRFVVDPKAGANLSSLQRPAIWKETVLKVEAAGERAPDGRFIDPNTGLVIEGDYHIGHKYGYEHRRLVRQAESLGMTQAEFTEWVNSHPEWLQIEDPVANLSHRYEKPGVD